MSDWDVTGVPISVLNIIGVVIAWHHHPDEPAIQAALHDAVQRRLDEVAPSVSERLAMPDMRIYDPELYGRPVCGAATPWEPVERCNLADGHPGDHRWGSTFSESFPPVPVEDEPDPRPAVEAGVPAVLSNMLMDQCRIRARAGGFPKPPFSVRLEAARAATEALNGVVDGWCADRHLLDVGSPSARCDVRSPSGDRCNRSVDHEPPHTTGDPTWTL